MTPTKTALNALDRMKNDCEYLHGMALPDEAKILDLQLQEDVEAIKQALTENTWRDVSEAPKDGTEILGWRSDCGVFLCKYTCLSEILSTQELENMDLDEETVTSHDWFFAAYTYGDRLEDDLIPTKWMPKPEEPEQPPC